MALLGRETGMLGLFCSRMSQGQELVCACSDMPP